MRVDGARVSVVERPTMTRRTRILIEAAVAWAASLAAGCDTVANFNVGFNPQPEAGADADADEAGALEDAVSDGPTDGDAGPCPCNESLGEGCCIAKQGTPPFCTTQVAGCTQV